MAPLLSTAHARRAAILAAFLIVVAFLSIAYRGATHSGPSTVSANRTSTDRSAMFVSIVPTTTTTLGYQSRSALIVGINRYGGAHGFADLNGATYDAAEVANLLADRFGFEHVTLLCDQKPDLTMASSVNVVMTPQVSKSVLLNQIRLMAGEVRSDDGLLFFYAGHGTPEGLVPGDGDVARPETILAYEELATSLQQLNAHHTLLVLDCCFSGRMVANAARISKAIGSLVERQPTNSTDNLMRVFNRRAIQVLTAGAGDETVGDVAVLSKGYASLERDVQGHSPFTTVLLEGLRGLTGRPDGTVRASDLGYYMNQTLVDDPRIGARQAPRFAQLAGEGDFMFFPAKPVLNPKLLAPLYLKEPRYVELRRSALRSLIQSIGDAPREQREDLITAAVPHLARLVSDSDVTLSDNACDSIMALLALTKHQELFRPTVQPLMAVLRQRIAQSGHELAADKPLDSQGTAVLSMWEPLGALTSLNELATDESAALTRRATQLVHDTTMAMLAYAESEGMLFERTLQQREAYLAGLKETASGSPVEQVKGCQGQVLALISLLGAFQNDQTSQSTLSQAKALLAEGESFLAAADPENARERYTLARNALSGLGQPTLAADLALCETDMQWLPAAVITPFVHNAVFNENGTRMSYNGRQVTVDFPSSKIPCVIDHFLAWPSRFAISPDDTLYVVEGRLDEFELWSLLTRQRLTTLPQTLCDGDAYPTAFAFSHDNTLLAVGRHDGSVLIYDITKQSIIQTIPRRPEITKPAAVIDLRFAAGDRSLLSLLGNGQAIVWWTRDWSVAGMIGSDQDPVLCAAFARDQDELSVGGRDGKITVYRMDKNVTPTVLQIVNPKVKDHVTSLAYQPHGRILAGATAHGGVQLFDLTTGRALRALPPGGNAITNATFRGDMDALQFIPAARDEQRRHVLVQTDCPTPFIRLQNAYAKSANSARFSDDGNAVAVVTTRGSHSLWDLRSRREIWFYPRQHRLRTARRSLRPGAVADLGGPQR